MKKWSLLLGLAISLLAGRAQITLIITATPAQTLAGTVVYVAGNFNGWNPASTPMAPDSLGRWAYTVPEGAGTLEYKFTRGSWATVEGTAQGGFRPNRTHVFGNGDTLYLQILGWEGIQSAPSTANNQVQVYDSQFFMPQLNRYRRIWVYLPRAYPDTARRFPVIYMHDGQNVFDASTSAFGVEWGVDETLSALELAGDSGAIVVAVDNGPSRLSEYTPWINSSYGGGNGDAYVDFLAFTLKPHIDSVFRTKPGNNHTGIWGSSLGGLISLYAHFQYPHIFGRAGVFSPSLWWSDSVWKSVSNASYLPVARVYLLSGGQEPASVAANNARMADSLQAVGYPAASVMNRPSPDGQHQEAFWAREFEAAYRFLFAPDALASINRSGPLQAVRFFPNPTLRQLTVQAPFSVDMALWDARRRVISDWRTTPNHFVAELPALKPGIYWLQFSHQGASRTEQLLIWP